MSPQSNDGYATPEVLVDTEWVAGHINEPHQRLVEVDVDPASYGAGHIPGAVGWNWKTDTQDVLRRNLPNAGAFEALLGRSGITPETTVILYGDSNNWFAAYAYWMLKYYGHGPVRLINGGRVKWIAENRPMTAEVPNYPPVQYKAKKPQADLRALRDQVLERVGKKGAALVDVRSPKEYSGELLAPENLPQEGAQRGGHIAGAVNVPWAQAVREDGTFKSAEELKALYAGKGVTPDKEVIAYCRIGERSAHTWFVLKNLLGYPRVRNYDGSWTEWGSLIDVPIERG
ncbi:MAG TPA: sulfurtransferase [Anaerolineales bacterium]|nr:sulfurtransferase [Anaerolineales bacterium]